MRSYRPPALSTSPGYRDVSLPTLCLSYRKAQPGKTSALEYRYPHGSLARPVELGQEDALPASEVQPTTPHQQMLRPPEEAGQEVRVAVALGMLEAHVEGLYQCLARSSEVESHVGVVVLVDGDTCGRMGGGDHAKPLLHTRLPNRAAYLLCYRHELVARPGPNRYVAEYHGPPFV